MISNIFQHGIRFVFLLLLQGLILNNVDLFGYVNPNLYILFILLLPVEANAVLVLGLSLVYGMCIDMFSLTWGMHTSACLFIAFIRPYLFRIMSPRDGYVFGVTPDMSNMGIGWFLTYAFIMTFLHHLFLYYVEVFRFEEFFFTFGRAFLSSLFTIVLILFAQFLTYRQIRQ